MNKQQIVLANILYYDTARHFLPKVNKNWFTDPFAKKLIDVMTDMYFNDETIDIVTLAHHFERIDMVKIVKLQQEASGIHDIKPHLKYLEYEYLRDELVRKISNIDINKDLKSLVNDLQDALEATTFSTNKEAEQIIKLTNIEVDRIIENSQKGNTLSGKPTGWKFLDKYLGGYNEGDLIVVAGRPGMGKTALALSLMKEFANLGGKGLFLSLEMPSDQLARRYISLLGNIDNWKIRSGSLQAYEIDKVIDMANNQKINFWVDDEINAKLAQVKAKAKIHKSKHGLEVLMIDYLQLMTGTKDFREQEIAEISRGLKMLAKELKCTVMALAQLSRKSEDRADKRPLLSDLRESGAIEQDADVVMFPFRPAYYQDEKPEIEDAQLIIMKNRNGECATIPTFYEGRLTSYTENTAPKISSPFEF
jgi:replicative DNA helicase